MSGNIVALFKLDFKHNALLLMEILTVRSRGLLAIALLGLCCKRKETPNEHGLLWRYAGVSPLARGRAIRGSAIAPFSARRAGLKTLRAAAIPHAKGFTKNYLTKMNSF